MRRGCYM